MYLYFLHVFVSRHWNIVFFTHIFHFTLVVFNLYQQVQGFMQEGTVSNKNQQRQQYHAFLPCVGPEVVRDRESVPRSIKPLGGRLTICIHYIYVFLLSQELARLRHGFSYLGITWYPRARTRHSIFDNRIWCIRFFNRQCRAEPPWKKRTSSADTYMFFFIRSERVLYVIYNVLHLST